MFYNFRYRLGTHVKTMELGIEIFSSMLELSKSSALDDQLDINRTWSIDFINWHTCIDYTTSLGQRIMWTIFSIYWPNNPELGSFYC